MRLRQIALVAHDLEPVAAQLSRLFDLKVAFRDPGVGVFGLVNVVMPVGGEFLEIVQPVRPDASAARYLTRRGGDAGYMAIFQDEDALAHRERLAAQGVRLIAEMDRGGYVFTHFHPADFTGVLSSIDQVRDDPDWMAPLSKWPPAGNAWRDFPSSRATGLIGCVVQARDPERAAAVWAERLASSVTKRQGMAAVVLARGEIRFSPPVDSDGTGIVALDFTVRDPKDVFDAAEAAGVTVADESVSIGGVRIHVAKG